MTPVYRNQLPNDPGPELLKNASYQFTRLRERGRCSPNENDPDKWCNEALKNQITEVTVKGDDLSAGLRRPLNDFEVACAGPYFADREHVVSGQSQ